MVDAKPATGTAVVTVYSKLPIALRCVLHAPRTIREATMGGFRDVEQSFPTDKEFVLKGTAPAQNEAPRCEMVAGFAVTKGIPKDLWEAWVKQNAEMPAVKKGMIVAHEVAAKGADAARENKVVKTGLERVNPNDPTQISPIFKVEMAPEQVVKPVLEDA